MLSDIVAELPSGPKLGSLPTGTVSAPIDDNGTWLLLQITSRTPTPFAKAKASVSEAVQAVGAKATQAALTRSRAPLVGQRRPSLRGVGTRARRSSLVPFTPRAD